MGELIITYVYVVADILHKGHLMYLENASGVGDSLIVGVLTNEAVMEKKSEPTLSFENRCDIIRSLQTVDAVVPQEAYSPVNNIITIKPDIVFESNSHDLSHIQSTINAAESVGARVIVMPYSPIQSSSGIKEAIHTQWKLESVQQ